MSIDFTLDERLKELKERTRSFIDGHVVPAEGPSSRTHHGPEPQLREQLQERARRAGVFAPTAPVEHGGLGLDHRSQAIVLEEAGRSLLGPLALNCAAPDEGNMLLLDRIGDQRQRAGYLDPLARGEIRSAFAMTEPAPGAGADPQQLRTSAVRTEGGWRLDGEKWFITGADGAAFLIVMARTAAGATMFLVDADNPGLSIRRRIESLDDGFIGGHCEVWLTECIVAEESVLGAVGNGFRDVQVRLGPARLTHCMRWLGAARRAHETAVRYAADRPMFGSVLAEQGMAQRMVAENEVDIAACRALIWQAAWALDTGSPARQETGIAKVFVAEAVNRVVDRSVQLAGAFGISYDSPLPQLLREVRPFRIYDGPTEVHLWALARRVFRGLEQGRRPGDFG
jgi:acyl-CoA dehydrogenase